MRKHHRSRARVIIITVTCILCALFTLSCSFGNDDAVAMLKTTSPAASLVYVSGMYNRNACLWVGSGQSMNRIDLPTAAGSPGSSANSVYVYGNRIYVAGTYTNSSGFSVPCFWVNGALFDLPGQGPAGSAGASDIFVDGGIVYISGMANNHACLWIDGIMTVLPDNAAANSVASSIAVSQGIVYAGGAYNAGSTFGSVWVNGSLAQVFGPNAAITSIALENQLVYGAGYYNLAPNRPAYFINGNSPTFTLANDGMAKSIFVSNGIVYVAGQANLPPAMACLWINDAGTRIDIQSGSVSVANCVRVYSESISDSNTTILVAGSTWDGATDTAWFWHNGRMNNLASNPSFIAHPPFETSANSITLGPVLW